MALKRCAGCSGILKSFLSFLIHRRDRIAHIAQMSLYRHSERFGSHTHSDNFAHAKQIKQTSRVHCDVPMIISAGLSERSAAAKRYRFSRVIAAILLAGALNFRTARYRKYHVQCSLEETIKSVFRQHIRYFKETVCVKIVKSVKIVKINRWEYTRIKMRNIYYDFRELRILRNDIPRAN